MLSTMAPSPMIFAPVAPSKMFRLPSLATCALLPLIIEPVESLPLMSEIPVLLIDILSPSKTMPVPPPLTVTSPEKVEEVLLPEISAPVAPSTVVWPEIVLVVLSPVITRPTAPPVTVESPVSVLWVLSPEIIAAVLFAPLISNPRSVILVVPSPAMTCVFSLARIKYPRLSYFQY